MDLLRILSKLLLKLQKDSFLHNTCRVCNACGLRYGILRRQFLKRSGWMQPVSSLRLIPLVNRKSTASVTTEIETTEDSTCTNSCLTPEDSVADHPISLPQSTVPVLRR